MKIRILAAMLIVAFAVIATGTRDSQAASDNSPFVPGQLIVAMVDGANASEVAADHGATVSSEIAGGRFVLLNVAPGKEGQAARSLNGDRRVSFAEPNWLREIHASPDDADYNLKWDLNNTGDLALCDGSDCPTADADMDWQEAYDFLGSSFNGSAIVAVIDTGIDPNHPDLSGKTVTGYDFLDNDNDPTDTYGHGTHVAGISLAATNNATGTAGVGYSPGIKVMPLRVCDQNGCPTSAIVNAIYHAADNGADVINMSIGGIVKSRAEESAVNYAWSKGLVIVASSGNGGSNKVSYPAKFKKVIAVGSTDWNDARAPYSNGGKDLDVVAPGGRMDKLHDKGGIYSTMPTYPVYLTTQYGYSQGYDQLQGTSMAGPQVAGLAALLIAQDSSRSNATIRSIIESTTDDLGASGFDNDYGYGRVNVCKAVGGTDCDGPPPPPNDAPVVSMTSPTEGSTFTATSTVLFEGTASDTEDGSLTASMAWTSSIDGSIDDPANDTDGGSFTATLSDGVHTITALAIDSGGKMDSASIS
ncbi:MAG: peptidase S8, partial [Chloroflexi bacterium]|nr:peptidase S8 [Chloroflexota bacterium]